MATFDTITVLQRDEVAAFSFPFPGPCGTKNPAGAVMGPFSSPAPPVKASSSYTPIATTLTKSDPTRVGRDWSYIRKSGVISFTPYSVARKSVQEFVVDTEHRSWSVRRPWTSCTTVTPALYSTPGLIETVTAYQKHSSLSSVVANGTIIKSSSYSEALKSANAEVRDAIVTTQQAAYAEALSTYDLLTELAEAEKTLGYLQKTVSGAAEALAKFAHTDEYAWRRARSMSPQVAIRSTDKALRRFGSRWLEFRYAIMPLMYSIKDINDLLGDRNSVYKTGRNTKEIGFALDPDDMDLNSVDVYVTGSGQYRVSSVYKARYTRGALQRVLSQTSFNLFKTAWELVPYSLVVDWFLNVGKAITAATLVNSSSQSVGCTSVKRTVVKETRYRDFSTDNANLVIAAAGTLPQITVTRSFERYTDATLQRVVEESYSRSLYYRPEPQIVYDPFLNWKRFMDAFALSYQPIKKLLRSL